MRNVFISHIHEDDEGLSSLKELLQKHGITIRDYSINSDSPNNATSEEYIKSKILAPRIKQSGVFVVYITPGTMNSTYVNWEIEYAASLAKRIVGVWGSGDSGCEVPEALKKYGDAVVGWSGNRIIDAINGSIIDWENPDGSQCLPREIKRYSCG
jgi:hypothetical protein